MRRKVTALALLAVTALAPAVATTTPAHAASELKMVYSYLPYDTCIAFGQSGQQTGRWQTWWCSTHYPQTYPGYYTYDLWAYVN
ncbi:unnamed protein product [[Actinomadura] parvosata subsp. kistnae]|uniref:Secreted protein n=1 Tax=Nonomuraea composti TaxID=2720023 RepID=A0ABX1BCS3_9ACTN|nr:MULTISPECIES: hypothetical protein [unclassified Nonomuraea]NJP94197.1 hypothetical protein [Nonomuraea sp. FMUSA5-5]SPL93414.1 unnamed protein product [Actinomadura parvosata subsp. kistnae]